MHACESRSTCPFSCPALPHPAPPCPALLISDIGLRDRLLCRAVLCRRTLVVSCNEGQGQGQEQVGERERKKTEKKEETQGADINWCTRLEIGAGGGLVGLAVANGCRLGHPLHITDQLEMLSLMGHNVLLNNAKGRVKPSVLNWCVKTRSRLYYSLPHACRRPQIPTTLPPFVLLWDRIPETTCLSATMATCSVTPFCPIVSHPRCRS